MSAPFGNHPTLGQYLGWACGAGCSTKHGVTVGYQSVVRVLSPDGSRHLSIVGLNHDERLAPTTVARFDRRLGLKSPFSSLPE